MIVCVCVCVCVCVHVHTLSADMMPLKQGRLRASYLRTLPRTELWAQAPSSSTRLASRWASLCGLWTSLVTRLRISAAKRQS